MWEGGGEVLFTIFFDRGSPAPFLTVPMVGFLSYASYIAIKLWFSNCTVGSYVQKSGNFFTKIGIIADCKGLSAPDFLSTRGLSS